MHGCEECNAMDVNISWQAISGCTRWNAICGLVSIYLFNTWLLPSEMVELTHYLLFNHGKLASTSTCFLTWLPGCNSFFQHNFGWSHVGSAKPFGYNVVYTILLVQLVTQLLNCDGFLLLAWLLGLVLDPLHLPPGPPPIFMQWWHWIPWSQRDIGELFFEKQTS